VTAVRYGATASDWDLLDFAGLGGDLLPVVSRPDAVISPQSAMKGLGKTPSLYNRQRQVVGIPDWTSHVATDKDIKRWSAEPDYGVCIITRTVRALDVDVPDPALAKEIHDEIVRQLGRTLPTRSRETSSKFLQCFALKGGYPKRVIKTAHGVIEFLASGQQFIACGTHPSGARYEWDGGLPVVVPELTPDEFESLWAGLESKFAIEPSTTSNASVKAAKLAEAAANDLTAAALAEQGLVVGSEKDGRLHITCPWEDEHTTGTGGDTSTTYWPANTGGYQLGHFKCLHASHADKTDHDFKEVLGILDDPRDDFEAEIEAAPAEKKDHGARFTPIPDRDFKAGKPPGWLIKNVLPKAELGVVFGASGAGKSFEALDMAGAIARGIPWCGKATHKGVVLYIAAEGASGFRNRVNAYCETHDVLEMGIYIIPAAPNFMEGDDIRDLVRAILALGVKVDLVIVDTLAQVSAGANENSGEDMGKVIGHCGTLNKVTGAMVLLVHHSGKDAGKGARGWSGIKGSLNVEIEVTRSDSNRTTTITKMRDGEGEGDQYGFVLKTVPIGMDEDGDIVSSCVVEHGDVVAPAPREKALSKNEKILWPIIQELTDELAGKRPTPAEVLAHAQTLTDGRPGNLQRGFGLLEKRGWIDCTEGRYITIIKKGAA
jgi:hypothetical protein